MQIPFIQNKIQLTFFLLNHYTNAEISLDIKVYDGLVLYAFLKLSWPENYLRVEYIVFTVKV